MRMKFLINRIVCRIVCIMLTALLLLAVLPTAMFAEPSEEPSKEPLDTHTITTLNKPATVVVVTTWSADVSVRRYKLDEDQLTNDTTQELERMINRGEITTIPEFNAAKVKTSIRLFIANVEKYHKFLDEAHTEKNYMRMTGSGFIVTPDGYVVTNAHVVAPVEEDLIDYFLTETVNTSEDIRKEIDQAITDTVEEFRKKGYTMTQKEKDTLEVSIYDLIYKSISIGDIQTKHDCILSNVPPGSDVRQPGSDETDGDYSVQGIPMDLHEIGEAYPGQDIAILKMQGQTNLPTVTLADDTPVNQGEFVYAMGYSGAMTVDEHFENQILKSMEEPELTSGTLSAKQEMTGGWDAFQIDTTIHYGNTGGPLFNTSGEVIGVNTVGPTDKTTKALTPGMNYAVSTSVVKQYLDKMNVTPTESIFTANFRQGLEYHTMGKHHNHKAVPLLEEINETNPGFPVVQHILTEAQTQAAANPIILGIPTMIFFIIVGAVFVVIVAVVIIIIMLKRKKKKASANQNMGDLDIPMSTIPTNNTPSPNVYTRNTPNPNMYISTTPSPNMYTSSALSMFTNMDSNSSVPGQQQQTIYRYDQTTTAHQAMDNSIQQTITTNASDPFYCDRCGAVLRPPSKFCCQCGEITAASPQSYSASWLVQ
ncbi:MAG: trypsin-like peptidase domain-containing protein [Peptococcaceae bacterium]|nr:trypsin-like peptidase domain-containing protein [Peptococcaceae bacterium]